MRGEATNCPDSLPSQHLCHLRHLWKKRCSLICYFAPPPMFFSSQLNTVRCHIMEFCGFSTQ